MLPTPELEIFRNLPPERCSPEVAQRYTRWLATHHYENFTVVSWLLPRRLYQHFYNLYAYCRWSDDLGDEIPNHTRALRLLEAWEEELRAIYRPGAGPSHPVLIALRETVLAKDIPPDPFTDLLRAFRQDQLVHRYATWDDVLDYCVYSANPVGHLVLYLCDFRDGERQRLSDFTCTALQLANFWQDVSWDIEKGRIYIPLEALAAHGLTEGDIIGRRFDGRYAALMRSLIAKTRELFAAGTPLIQTVDASLRVDLELFTRGGEAVLEAIEKAGYNTLEFRPALSSWTKLRLVGRALAAKLSRGSESAKPVPPSGPPRSSEAESGLRPDRVPKAVPSAAEVRAIRDSYIECNRIARASRSSFYLAFFGLPKAKRNGLCALYAFMRLIDDVSDEPGDTAAKSRKLAHWRALLDECAAGATAGHAILPALSDTMRRFEIPTRYFHDLILGAEMDQSIRYYATFDRLSEYCYRVAGTVGLTCLHVFGFRDSRAPDLAERLGLAFQLTNIIRDVRSDYEMGRIYIPTEDLQRFACSSDDLRGPVSPKLRELLAFEADRAWRLYGEGAPLVQSVEADSRATLQALVRTYSSLLSQIEESGYDVFSSRISVSSAHKIRFLLGASLSSTFETRRMGWWKQDVLAKRSGDRRRSGGPGLERRAG